MKNTMRDYQLLKGSAENNTLLDYAITSSPMPLQVSPKDGNPSVASLGIVVSNGGTVPVYCDKIVFSFDIGDLAQNLTDVGTGILVAASPSEKWQIHPLAEGVFIATPKKPEYAEITADGLVFQIYNIKVNKQVGTFALTVQEHSSAGSTGLSPHTSIFHIAKFPYGFFVSDFTARVPEVKVGQPVELTWHGSDNAIYTILYSDQTVNVTNVRKWQSPPLVRDTVFILKVSVQSQGETVETYLATVVSVQHPQLEATSLHVLQTATVDGAMSVGKQGAAADLTVNGAVTINGNETLNGNETVSGNETVNGNAVIHGTLHVDGQTTLKSASADTLNVRSVETGSARVQENLDVAGMITGSAQIGGGAGVIKGYGTNSQAEFAFKYDDRNFGHSSQAIQIWNQSAMVYKTFVIAHPLDEERYMLHATLEGPEGGVYYRGTARLHDGRAMVRLPYYFEALTRREDRTILLTNIDGGDRLWVEKQDGEKIRDGVFVVVSDNPLSVQEFDWEVKAVRSDMAPLNVEPHRDEVVVQSFGPYAFAVPARDREPEYNIVEQEDYGK